MSAACSEFMFLLDANNWPRKSFPLYHAEKCSSDSAVQCSSLATHNERELQVAAGAAVKGYLALGTHLNIIGAQYFQNS